MSREKIFLLLFLPAVSNSAPWLQCPWEIYRQHLPWYRQTTPRMEAIDELMKAKTIIMIAHRTKTVQNADQILVVDEGKVVQRGKHIPQICVPEREDRELEIIGCIFWVNFRDMDLDRQISIVVIE